MDLSLLRGFLEIARFQNFHEAADELYITQSALTKQMKRLEQELGVTLFDRSARRIALTDAGRTLLRCAPDLLDAFDAMCEAVNPSRLRLRVGVLPVMAFYGIVDLFTSFSREQPQINLSLQEYQNDALPPALRRGEADLIFWRCPETLPEDLKALTVCEDELALVVPAAHPLAQRETVSLREFSEENFIFLSKSTQLYNDSLDACRAAGFQPRILFTGSSVENVGQLVRRNGCAAIFMRQVALGIGDPGLRVLHFIEAPLTRLVLAAVKERPLSPSAQLFWKLVQASLRQP